MNPTAKALATPPDFIQPDWPDHRISIFENNMAERRGFQILKFFKNKF
jgi:hypothetical protein